MRFHVVRLRRCVITARFTSISWWQLFVTIGLIIILVLIMFVWLLPSNYSDSQDDTTADDLFPDYFGNHVTVYDYKATDYIVNKMVAASIEHYFSDDHTSLSDPELWEYDKKAMVRWHAAAERGIMPADRQTFKLQKNVVVVQPAASSQEEIRLTTDEMTIYTKENIVDTDSPVTVIRQGSKLKTIGMKYFYRRNIVQLKSHVSGVAETW